MDGISFIVRIRNEGKTLGDSIRSLGGITVPHEIILILHRCTDESSQIAQQLAAENRNVRVLTYDIDISRPGYETLATDSGSPHSLMTYYNWSMRQGRYAWIFKWDADFMMTDALKNRINSMAWPVANCRISIIAKNSVSANRENYLISMFKGYGKHVFWEFPSTTEGSEQLHIPGEMYIEHASELSDLKTYWKEPAWFETEDSDEARTVKNRIDRLTAEFGNEPRGLARASNPECDSIFSAIVSANNCKGPDYVQMFN